MARVGVFSWLPLFGVVGLRWWADVTRLCVCLCWCPALVPTRVCLLATASLRSSRMWGTVVPVQIEKLRIFRSTFWVSVRENLFVTREQDVWKHMQ